MLANDGARKHSTCSMFHQWLFLEFPSSVILAELLSECRRLRGHQDIQWPLVTQGRKSRWCWLVLAWVGSVKCLGRDDDGMSGIKCHAVASIWASSHPRGPALVLL